MRARSERKVFQEIMTYSREELRAAFDFQEEHGVYFFTEKVSPKHFVSVDKERSRGDPYWTPVNADFGFDRTAGSNNYPELLDVARRLAQAFDKPLFW